MPRTPPTVAAAHPTELRSAPVLGVLVCHDGARWLPDVLAALRELTVAPRNLIAVDTGSTDATPELLAAAGDLLDGVLTLPRDTGFGAAVAAAVEHGEARWGDPGRWVWLLHDDAAPEPGCLAALLTVAALSPSAALLGPLCLDWDDPRLIIEAGVSTDAAGHRQTGIGAVELDLGQFGQNAEVLAVSSAGALVRREVWTALGGYDPAMPLLCDDLDFGWRVNRAGHVVLCVPAARLRHAAALAAGQRSADAVGNPARVAERAHGVRTFLVNCSTAAFLVGLPRLVMLGVLRAAGFLLVRRAAAARAELAALRRLVSGRAGLRAARRARRTPLIRQARSVQGLLTSRLTRVRNATRAGLVGLVRRRIRADAALGRLPAATGATVAVSPPPRPVGPAALPAGAMRRRTGASTTRRAGGLRRPSPALAVTVGSSEGPETAESPAPPDAPQTRPRPSPLPRAGAVAVTDPPARNGGRLVMVDARAGRMLAEVLLAVPVLLVAVTTLIAVLVHRGRLGLDLAGGRLLPPESLAATWSSYLAGWHPVGGGSAAPAPATLAVLGVLGLPVGSPPAAASLLLLGATPLAALSAYLATRSLPVPRLARALVAAAYGLLPAGVAAVAQGRLDVVVAHVLLPPVLAGTAAVLRAGAGWFATACTTALGLAVLGAFIPVLHLLVLAVALIGFVLAPAKRPVTWRRAAGLFTLVLLPLGLLLPWPAVVVQRPSLLVHGVGAVVDERWPGWLRILVGDPGGPGTVPWLGALVLLGALVAMLLRPRRAMLPGLGVVLLGLGAAALLGSVPVTPLTGGAPRPGFTGAPLLLAACGLLWVVLVACPTAPDATSPRRGARFLPAAGFTGVAALAAGAVLAGGAGPLAPDSAVASADRNLVALAPALATELDRDDTAVLVVGVDEEPVWLTRGATPRFGDGAIAPLRSTVARLERVSDALRSGETGAVGAAIADVAASGVEFVVLPETGQGERALAAAGPLARAAPPTTDGRPVLRVVRPSPGAELLGPQLARQARSGASPPTEPGTTGVPVDATPPTVAARVAPGAAGRLLVLAANDEPGWRATVNGAPVPTVRAWGHQVAVEVPPTVADVRVDRSEAVRAALLLGQAALLLLALATAVPTRRRATTEVQGQQ